MFPVFLVVVLTFFFAVSKVVGFQVLILSCWGGTSVEVPLCFRLLAAFKREEKVTMFAEAKAQIYYTKVFSRCS